MLRRPVIGLMALVILGGLLFGLVAYPPSEWVPAVSIGEDLEAAGFPGLLAFLGVGVLATAIGFPRQMVAFIAGLAYGVMPGLLASLVSALMGCFLTAFLSRRFFSASVLARFPGPAAQLERMLRNDFFVKILVLRLQPLGTNLLTNILIGFTATPLRIFIAASAVGYIPQMLVFSLLGSGIRVGSQTQLIVSAVLLLLSLMLGTFVYRRHKARQSN